MNRYPDHPLAALFPMMEGKDFDSLVADIRQNGLREPIVLFEGQVLDGRNRAKACAVADVDPQFEAFDGSAEEATSFVVSLNLRRRHLSESQRATVAARLANMRQGERTDLQPSANLQKVEMAKGPAEVARPSAPTISQGDAARMLNVSQRSVASAKAMIEKAVPGLVKAVDQGKLSVAAALVASKQPPAEQKRFVEVPKTEQRQVVRDWRAAQKAKVEPIDEDMEIETVALGFLQIHRAKVEPRRLARQALAGTIQDMREHGVRVRQFLEAIEEAARHDAA